MNVLNVQEHLEAIQRPLTQFSTFQISPSQIATCFNSWPPHDGCTVTLAPSVWKVSSTFYASGTVYSNLKAYLPFP